MSGFRSKPRSFKSPSREVPAGAAITAIQASTRDPDIRIVKAGRRTVATLSRRDAEAMAIRVGLPWTETLAARAAAAEQRRNAEAYAKRLLAGRGLSRMGLVQRLTRRGLSAPDAAGIADRMAAIGLLNEAAYAENVVRTELERKPAGRMLLMARLRQRGVNSATASKTVEEAIGGEDYDPLPGALALARKRLRTMSAAAEPEAVRRRLFSMLARRGFDPETCREAVGQALGREEAD